MKFFKLRFIPLGKFYKPSKGYPWEKNNLSPTGKTYTKKALNFKDVSKISILKNLLPERPNVSYTASKGNYGWKSIETVPEDWEWVEYEVVEKETSPIK